jgi:hypothetical protein
MYRTQMFINSIFKQYRFIVFVKLFLIPTFVTVTSGDAASHHKIYALCTTLNAQGTYHTNEGKLPVLKLNFLSIRIIFLNVLE